MNHPSPIAVLEPVAGRGDWESRYAGRARRMRSSAIRELLKVTEMPEMISFGGGMPAPEMFPLEAFQSACQHVLRTQGPQALQYGPTEGYAPLRRYLADRLGAYGLPAGPDNILLTNGSQQALDLLGKVFIDGRQPVCVERPTYLGALQAWRPYGARYCAVALTEDGMDMDDLQDVIQRHRPKFVYVLPNFQNPSGVSLSAARRSRLAELIPSTDAFIVEDDPYGELRFEGEALEPVIARTWGQTLYLSTFSKTLSPGIRLGWIVGPPEVIRKLVQAKQGADLHTGTFVQMVAYELCRRGVLDDHVPRIRQTYRERRDAMLAAMSRYFPVEVRWTRPQGGLFLWVTVPPPVDTVELLQAAIAKKVAFVPGDSFFPDGAGRQNFRLNFSYCQPEVITEGIRRLGSVLARAIA